MQNNFEKESAVMTFSGYLSNLWREEGTFLESKGTDSGGDS